VDDWWGLPCPARGPGLSHTRDKAANGGGACIHCDAVPGTPPTPVVSKPVFDVAALLAPKCAACGARLSNGQCLPCFEVQEWPDIDIESPLAPDHETELRRTSGRH
jgi:hypothetical protein